VTHEEPIMSMVPGGSPGQAGFAGGYQASPHAGLPDSDHPHVEVTTESRAWSALVLGLLGIVPFGILTGIPAILLGAHALRRIEISDGALRGRRLAWCGIVLGCLSIAIFAVIVYRLYS
jgi:hypothetical protein